jgi:DNA-binding transcriptional LysR family regulator
MDRLQTMSVFVAVAERSGFAPAARQLNMSPPSITRAISELESRIGSRLFHRTTRSVRLTEAGERYLADCRRILSDIDSAEQQAAGLHSKPSGLVTVTASVMFGRKVLAPVLLDLLAEYADISITGVFTDRLVHMYEDGIDVAVRIADLPDSSLTAIRVGSVRTVLCASHKYLEQNGRPQKPSDLARHTLIDFVNLNKSGEWVFEAQQRSVTHEPRSRLHVNTGEVALEAARSGFGITRVLSYMIAEEIDSGDLQVVLEDYEPAAVPIHIVHKEAGQTAARVRAVVDYLVQGLRNHPALS